MNAIENLLIMAGISLDIFAAMECQGALVVKVDKKKLALLSVIVLAWQMASLLLGSYLAKLLYRNELAYEEHFLGMVIAAVILFALGVRLIIKAIRNERIDEHGEADLALRKFVRMEAVTSFCTLFAGFAFGFLGTTWDIKLLAVCILTVIGVVAGIYIGYYMGFVHKTKAYICGALLLWIAGVDVIVGHIMC